MAKSLTESFRKRFERSNVVRVTLDGTQSDYESKRRALRRAAESLGLTVTVRSTASGKTLIAEVA